MPPKNRSKELQFTASYDPSRIQKRAYRRNDAWEDHKEFILDHLQRKTKHERILEALKSERGFNTKANQLKRQLGIWGLSKRNLNRRQRKWILQVTEARKKAGKDSKFHFTDSGLDLGETQLAAVFKASTAEFSDDVVPTPGDLQVETPPPMELDEPEFSREGGSVEPREPSPDPTETGQQTPRPEGSNDTEMAPVELTPQSPVLSPVVKAESPQDSSFLEEFKDQEQQFYSATEAGDHTSPGTIGTNSTPPEGVGGGGSGELDEALSPSEQGSVTIEDDASDIDEVEEIPRLDLEEVKSSQSSEPTGPISLSINELLNNSQEKRVFDASQDQVYTEDVVSKRVFDASAIYMPQVLSLSEIPKDVDDDIAYQDITLALYNMSLREEQNVPETPEISTQDAHTDSQSALGHEYRNEVLFWISDHTKSVFYFIESVATLVRMSGESFTDCFTEAYSIFHAQFEFQAPPYPVCLSMLTDQPIKDIQGNPIKVLSQKRWNRIRKIHATYYPVLKDLTDLRSKYVEPNEDVRETIVDVFHRYAAHLIYLLDTYGEANYFTIASLARLAELMSETSCTDEEDFFVVRSAYKAMCAIGMQVHPDNLEVIQALATRYEREDPPDYVRALQMNRLIYSMQSRTYGPGDPAAIQFFPNVINCYWSLGEYDAAFTIMRSAIRTSKLALDNTPIDNRDERSALLDTIYGIAKFFKLMKKQPERHLVLKWLIYEFRKLLAAGSSVGEDRFFAESCLNAGEAYTTLGDYTNAVRMFQHSTRFYKNVYGETYWRTLQSIKSLCKAMDKRGMGIMAVPILQRTWTLAVKRWGKDHERTYDIWVTYSRQCFKVNGRIDELQSLGQYLAHNGLV